jgi:uncharacterized protein (DUF58 family)
LRLTAFGYKSIAFYGVVVLAFFASPYSNLFFLLLGFLTLTGLASIVWTRANIRGLQLSVPAPDPIEAGVAQTLSTRVHSEHARTAYHIQIKLDFEAGPSAIGSSGLLDTTSAPGHEIGIAVKPAARGVYKLRSATLVSDFPLGLLRVRRRFDLSHELIVYPKPAQLVSARTGADALGELIGQPASGSEDLQPSGMRDHREGDELRSVHWRATARRGKPVVREWESGGGRALEIVLDRRCDAESLEEALGVISALVVFARTHKEILAIHSQGLSTSFGEGHKTWKEALKFLAAANCLPANAAAPPPVSLSILRLPSMERHAG